MTDKYSDHSQGLPYVLVLAEETKNQAEQKGNQKELRVGDLCPKCQNGHLDYNGLLNLECDACMYTLSGCFT
jgi:uncharacterized protein (DUF983 family)